MGFDIKDFVVTGQVVMPPLMWALSGSVEVFAVTFLLTFFVSMLTLMTADPVPPPDKHPDA